MTRESWKSVMWFWSPGGVELNLECLVMSTPGSLLLASISLLLFSAASLVANHQHWLSNF